MERDERDGFYEDDEPVEEIIQAFEAGVKGTTAAPSRGWTVYLDVGWVSRESGNEPASQLPPTGPVELTVRTA